MSSSSLLRSPVSRPSALPRLLWALAALAVVIPRAAAAHGATSTDLPLAPVPFALKHRRPAEIVALFARERLPGSGGVPRAARAGNTGSLVPAKVEAVMQGPDGHSLLLVGMADGMPEMRECVRMLDVPVERTPAGRQRMVLTLQHAAPASLRREVLQLPEAGAASARGRQLILEGSAEWLHRALRQVIRAELHPRPEPAEPRL